MGPGACAQELDLLGLEELEVRVVAQHVLNDYWSDWPNCDRHVPVGLAVAETVLFLEVYQKVYYFWKLLKKVLF